jgi:hypothetical protein
MGKRAAVFSMAVLDLSTVRSFGFTALCFVVLMDITGMSEIAALPSLSRLRDRA